MKSAYELALERMEQDGIEPPGSRELSAQERDHVADVRSRAEAKLAELEILRQDRLAKSGGATHPEDEQNYLRDRQRIEADRDRKLEQIRRGNG